VSAAEATGYTALFVPEIAAREAFTSLTAFAGWTDRVRLGTGVVTTWSRTPPVTAMAAATVHEYSEGRAILGVGSGTAPAGQDPGSALERVRAYVRTVRTILSGETVGPGDPFGADGFRLGLELPDGAPPIWVAALGDRMVRLAAEVGDGMILNWCTPGRVAVAREILDDAAERAGRDPADLTVAVYVRACLGVNRAVAMEVLGAAAAQYAAMPHYHRQLEGMGLGQEGRAAEAAFRAGRLGDVPESLVRELTVSGGRSEVLERFESYREAGADLVICYPVPALEPVSSIMGTLLAAAPNPAFER